MEYYDPNNRAPVRWASIATVIYLLIMIVLMIFVRFSSVAIDQSVDGILVQFGDDEFGDGEQELLSHLPTAEALEDIVEELLSDPNSDSEVEIAEPEEQQVTIEEVVEQREVNPNALFPGLKEQSTATSQGDNEQSGNQGSQSGAESGLAQGGGEGNSGIAELKDRSIVGSLPLPSYKANNLTGRVVIEITVDESGRVKSATYRAQGSTTNNSQLVTAAQNAALKARFTPSSNFIQGGTITYTFKLD